MTSVIDINAFPHIVDAILDFAVADEVEPAWPLTLGTVCRAWNKDVSRKIGYHLLSVCYQVLPTHQDLKRWDELNDVRIEGEDGDELREPVRVEDRKYWQLLSNLGGAYSYFERHGSLEFETLRPALFPGYDVCDLTVLDRATLHSEKLATVCPHLHTLRIVTSEWRPPPDIYPYASTYVWFGAPHTHTFVGTPAAICNKDTRKIVIVNWNLGSSKTAFIKLTQPPAIERPENVSEIVFVLFGMPADGIEHWIQWSINRRIRTTVVLVSGTAESCRRELESGVGIPLMKSDTVTFVTADSYRRRVGDKTFIEETELYLSPVELANKWEIHSSRRSMTLTPMLLDSDVAFPDRVSLWYA